MYRRGGASKRPCAHRPSSSGRCALLFALLLSARTAAQTAPRNHPETAKNAKTVLMSFERRDLTEVIQFVSQFTQRNFILPERVAGKITILSNSPIKADEVWNVFLAALEATNWAVYPVGSYWKLVEKKQSSRSGVPTFLDAGEEAHANEQMVTKLFKLRFADPEPLRNVLSQFTSRDSDIQIFPPNTVILTDTAMNLRRLEKLLDQLDAPGATQEIHVVNVQHAGAQDLAQKISEVLQAQSGTKSAAPAPRILADDRTNKLIVIGSEKPFQLITDLLRQLDVPTGDGGVHVYYLEHAKAEEVATTLQNVAQGIASSSARKPATTSANPTPQPPAPISAELFSGNVKVTADKTNNSLVVIASQSDWRNVVKLVERLDIPRRQVFVEAVIMEVNLEEDRQFGISAHGGNEHGTTFGNTTGTSIGVLGSELGGLSSLGGVSSLASLNGFLAGIQGPPITISGVSIPSFGILLQALQSSSDVNVISTPHVIMTDNTEGEITVGQNVPFQSGYAPNTGTTATLATSLGSLYAPIQRQNVELRLHIKPQINEGDFVRLEVDEQTEEIATVDATLGPTTSKRAAKTTVVTKDQETIVIGGLIQERVTKSVSKVPVLGSIPVLGALFRNESTKRQRTNLLLFLTPYIIRDQGDVRRIFERKMAERAEFVRRFQGESEEERRFIDYDRKPSALSRIRRGVAEELSKIENGGAGAPGEKVVRP